MAADDTLSELSNTDWMTFAVLSNQDHVTNIPTSRPTAVAEEEEEPRVVDITPAEPSPPPAPSMVRPLSELGLQELPRHEPPRPSTPPADPVMPPSPPPLNDTYEQHPSSAPPPLPPTEEERSYQPPPPPDPEDEETKRTLLLDLQALAIQGMTPTKTYTMESRTEDIMLEIRRLTLAMDEASNVGMMRDGLRLFVTGIEMVNNRIGLLDLEGWSADVCRDMNKFDPNLSRIYRRWWKRSTSSSPELDVCLSLVGSMGFHHMKRTMSKQLISGGRNGFAGGNAPAAASSAREGGGTDSVAVHARREPPRLHPRRMKMMKGCHRPRVEESIMKNQSSFDIVPPPHSV